MIGHRIHKLVGFLAMLLSAALVIWVAAEAVQSVFSGRQQYSSTVPLPGSGDVRGVTL